MVLWGSHTGEHLSCLGSRRSEEKTWGRDFIVVSMKERVSRARKYRTGYFKYFQLASVCGCLLLSPTWPWCDSGRWTVAQSVRAR